MELSHLHSFYNPGTGSLLKFEGYVSERLSCLEVFRSRASARLVGRGPTSAKNGVCVCVSRRLDHAQLVLGSAVLQIGNNSHT